MALIRWDPMVNEVRAMARRMERMLDPLLNIVEPISFMANGSREPWPPVDVFEDRDEILLRADLPGLERKSVEVLLQDSNLTLRGERRLDKEDKRESYHRIECNYGTFSRSFSMPATIDHEKIRAEMKDGILFVHVPKREGTKGRAIVIEGV